MPDVHGSPHILILSADNTGSGHKSITEALRCQLELLCPGVRLTVVDGFTLGRRLTVSLGKLYNPVAVNLPKLWGWSYRRAEQMPQPINALCRTIIRRRLLQRIREVRPQVIVSVHGLFVGSVLDVLEEAGLRIPFLTVIADLDNVSRLWADARATAILCPTQEAKAKMLQVGMPPEKLRVVGFPVRAQFCRFCGKPGTEELAVAEEAAPLPATLRFLIVSGSQGSGQVGEITRTLLKTAPSTVTIIAGSNQVLKDALEKELAPHLGTKVRVLGFTREMKERMEEADILVVRASPNVLMEAVNLNRPVIVIGSLEGQEEKNPAFVENHGLGVVCNSPEELPQVVSGLLADGGKQLRQIRRAQRIFCDKNAAEHIAKLVLEALPASPGK